MSEIYDSKAQKKFMIMATFEYLCKNEELTEDEQYEICRDLMLKLTLAFIPEKRMI